MKWPVYKGRDRVAWALIDDADVPLIADHLWRLSAQGYAITHRDGRRIAMQRLLLGLEPQERREVDHVNRDRLDNRRENLRSATRQQNLQNLAARGGRSQHRGVSFCKQTGRWVAKVKIGYQEHWLGRHDTEEQAAAVASAYRAEHMPFSADARAAA